MGGAVEFDIHALDSLDDYDEEKTESYREELLQRFLDSPEGQLRLEADPDSGYWASSLIRYGATHVGTTIPQMTREDVEEILTELFPSKISLLEPEEADATIPELVAFWEYLKREYGLPQADGVIEFLREVGPGYRDIMFDPSKFGMAKSLIMLGHERGFDMTSEEGINAFMVAYNASLPPLGFQGGGGAERGLPSGSGQHRMARRKKRKASEAARRRNRAR